MIFCKQMYKMILIENKKSCFDDQNRTFWIRTKNYFLGEVTPFGVSVLLGAWIGVAPGVMPNFLITRAITSSAGSL